MDRDAEIAAMESEIARHKAAIKIHRQNLHAAKKRLLRLQCERSGIRFIEVGEGGTHGQATDSRP